jgi:hypothetical protein
MILFANPAHMANFNLCSLSNRKRREGKESKQVIESRLFVIQSAYDMLAV